MHGLGVGVNGRFHILPQVIPILDGSELVSVQQGAQNILCLIGTATGLIKPKTLTAINPTTGVLERLLVPGSELLKAARLAINPSAAVAGAAQLRLITTNPATQSSVTLQDKAGTPANVVKLISNGWGAKFNDITVEVDDVAREVTLVLDDATEIFTYGTGAGSLQSLVDSINERSVIVTATLVAAGDETLAKIATAQKLTGGTDGTPTSQDMTDVFAVLDQHRVNIVCLIDPDLADQMQLVAHVESKRRIGFCGHSLQTGWGTAATRATNLANLTTRAAALSSKKVLFNGIGIDGLASYISVAKWAGIAAGTDPSVPLNNKDLRAITAEVDLSVSEIENLLSKGVAIPVRRLNQVAPGFMIADGPSTYTANHNLADRLISVQRGALAMEDDIVNEIEQFLGQEATQAITGRIVSAVNRRLTRALEPNVPVRIAGFDPTQTSATFESTILRVFYSFEPVQPVRFIVAIGSLKPTVINRVLEIPLGS